MGYKIEIILISIAIFLTGLIVAVNVLKSDEPEPIVLEKYSNSSAVSDDNFVSTNEATGAKAATKKASKELTSTQEVLQTESAEIAENINNKEISQKININTASKEELMSLSGIGEALSERIIEYRKTAKFNSIEEITNVYGIGEKTFEKLKDSITV